MPHAYADLVTFRRTVGDDQVGADRDADYLRALEAASADIDAATERTFQPYRATRLYTYAPGGAGLRYHKPLWIADLITLDTLVVDDVTWAADEYVLLPTDAPDRDRPYTRIAAADEKAFSTLDRAISLTGLWGYRETLAATGTTLSASATAAATTLTAASGTGFSPGQTLLIDTEQVYLTAVADTTLTVERGANGTTAATHSSGATIRRYTYPAPVTLAALELASQEGAVTGQSGIVQKRAGDLAITYAATSTVRQTAFARLRSAGLRRGTAFA